MMWTLILNGAIDFVIVITFAFCLGTLTEALAGVACNIIAVLFLPLIYIFAFFPLALSPNAESMDWNYLVYGAVLFFSVVYYFVFVRPAYMRDRWCW